MLNTDFNSDLEIFPDENDFCSLIGSSLRNVIENSVIDLILPYRILSISHLSSWKTFEYDIIQMLKQYLFINQQTKQDLILLNQFDRYTNNLNKIGKEENCSFEILINCNINLINIKSDFDRLQQLM